MQTNRSYDEWWSIQILLQRWTMIGSLYNIYNIIDNIITNNTISFASPDYGIYELPDRRNAFPTPSNQISIDEEIEGWMKDCMVILIEDVLDCVPLLRFLFCFLLVAKL